MQLLFIFIYWFLKKKLLKEKQFIEVRNCEKKS